MRSPSVFEPIPRVFFARDAAVPQLDVVRSRKSALLIDAGIERVLLLRFNAAMAAMSRGGFHRARARVATARARGLGRREFPVRSRAARRSGAAEAHRREPQASLLDRSKPVVADGRMHLEFAHPRRARRRRFRGGERAARAALRDRRTCRARPATRPQARLSDGESSARIARLAGRRHFRGARARRRAISRCRRSRASACGPTVNGKEPLLEAHLFDFDGDLYGKTIQVEFVEKLRDEEKFDRPRRDGAADSTAMRRRRRQSWMRPTK